MNDDRSQDLQAQVLIDQISADAGAEIAEIMAEAARDAQSLTRTARGRARMRVSAAIAEMRQSAERDLTRAEARLETERRQLRQTRDSEAMRQGLAGLDAELARLWQDPDGRANWCTNLLAEAGRRLMPGQWRITLAPGLGKDGLAALKPAVKKIAGKIPELVVDDALGAGLIVTSGDVSLDGSLAALTADQPGICALFLSELEHLTGERDR